MEGLCLAQTDVDELADAIKKDCAEGETKTLGSHVPTWMANVAKATGKGAAKVAGGVATATLSKAILAYFGLE